LDARFCVGCRYREWAWLFGLSSVSDVPHSCSRSRFIGKQHRLGGRANPPPPQTLAWFGEFTVQCAYCNAVRCFLVRSRGESLNCFIVTKLCTAERSPWGKQIQGT